MSTPQPPVVRWHHARWISYALVIAGVLAVMVGVADPYGGRVAAEPPALIMSRIAGGLVTLAWSCSTALA